jgi:hypothetical protein
MNAMIGANNPLTWVHFQLRGGWKRALMFTIGGCIVLGALMMLSVVQTSPMGSYSGAMEGWAQGLLTLEGAILILYGASAVGHSIRTDLSGGLIESHRLMPVTAPRAVIGYLAGGGGMAVVLGGGVMFLDLFAAMAANISFDRWLMAQVALGGLTILIWLMAAMATFTGRVGGGLLITIVALGLLSTGFIFVYFPAVAILLLPSIERIFWEIPGQAGTLLLVALPLQVALGVLFYIACVRRYARDDVTCFGILPALGLLAAWVGMSMLGMRHESTLMGQYDSTPLSSRCVAAVAILMVLAILPLANAARVAAHSSSSLAPRRDRFLPWVVILASLGLTLILTVLVNRLADLPWTVLVQTLVVVGAWLLAMRFILGWVYKAVEGGFMIGFVWTLLTWFAPMVGDVILQSTLHPNDNYVAGPLFAVSPLGALIQIWSDATTPLDVTLGLAIQIALILIPLFLFARRRGANVPPVPSLAERAA